MNAFRLALFAGLLLILSSCLALNTPPAPTVPASRIPSMTPFASRTTAPSITFTPAPSPTATQPALPTATPKQGPTATFDMTELEKGLQVVQQRLMPPPAFDLQTIADARLRDPSPDELLSVADVISDQYSFLRENYLYDDEIVSLIDDELHRASFVLDVEFRFHYPHGLPVPEIFWQHHPLKDHSPYEYWIIRPGIFLNMLADAILQELSLNRIPLADGEVISVRDCELEPHQVELDRDPGREWVARLLCSDYTFLTWLALDEKPDSTYSKLTLDLPTAELMNYRWGWQTNFLSLDDFTGDGLSDLLLFTDFMVENTSLVDFLIAQGTKSGFQNIGNVDLVDGSTEYGGFQYKFTPPSARGWATLAITSTQNISWGCEWATLATYRWPNGRQQKTVTGEQPPDTPECALARAVNNEEILDNRAAINLLENALARFEESDSDQQAKMQFARFRLALLYAVEGQESSARRRLSEFIENYRQSETILKSDLLPLLDAPAVSAYNLCWIFHRDIDNPALPDEWFEHLTFGADGSHFMIGMDYLVDPNAACNLLHLTVDLLSALRFDPQKGPEQALQAKGIPVAALSPYPVPGQSHPAWVALLGQNKYLASFVLRSDGWQWDLEETFDPAVQPVEIFLEDVTGDGYAELAFVLEYGRSDYCSASQSLVTVYLTSASRDHLLSLPEDYCLTPGKTIDIPALLEDQDGDGLVDWFAERSVHSPNASIKPVDGIPSLRWLTDAEYLSLRYGGDDSEPDVAENPTLLLSSTSLARERELLLAQRDRLDTGNPFFTHRWQHLTYLIAVCYELEGLTEEALQPFISIVQAESHTIWGTLAALHLEIK